MKLETALTLLNSERLGYLEFFAGNITGVERAGTLSAWIEFRSCDCPDVDKQERKALEVVKAHVAEIQRNILDGLGQTYTC